MASGFPGAIDNFSDPLANSPLDSPSHATLHSDVNDAVEKIETYMGLVKVIPTGATNGTVGATGTVTIGNAVASVTVSGVFSSLYDNYRIVVSGVDASAGNEGIKLTFGSTATGYYGSQYFDLFDGSSTGTTRLNNAANLLAGTTATDNDTSCSFDCNNPNKANRTNVHGTFSGGGRSGWFAGIAANTTQYTAFTLTPNAGTLTGGTITVYGYRN